MAKLLGGIYSRPAGKVGGLVFSNARTRIGKLTTVRTKVIPSNPKTRRQKTHRDALKESSQLMSGLSPSNSTQAFQRTDMYNAGFQAGTKLFVNNKGTGAGFDLPPKAGLGTFPEIKITKAQITKSTKKLKIKWEKTDALEDAGDPFAFFWLFLFFENLVDMKKGKIFKTKHGASGVRGNVGNTNDLELDEDFEDIDDQLPDMSASLGSFVVPDSVMTDAGKQTQEPLPIKIANRKQISRVTFTDVDIV